MTATHVHGLMVDLLAFRKRRARPFSPADAKQVVQDALRRMGVEPGDLPAVDCQIVQVVAPAANGTGR